MFHLKTLIIIIIIIMIITLFQEDNIFGTDVSLTYGPPLTDVDMLLRGRRIQKLLLVWKYTCTNKNGNFVKETDTSGYIAV